MTPLFTTFDSTRESLQDLLRHIQAGRLQLPDFQRGWVWDDHRIRDLLASVSRAFPIGAVMTLQTGNPQVRLHPRPVEGVRLEGAVAPERLILDGQQRLTSLYRTLLSREVVCTEDSRKNPIRRRYFIDLHRALDPRVDREDAILSLPEDGVQRDFRGQILVDASDQKKQCAAGLLPTWLLFDPPALTAWQMEYMTGGPPDQLMARVQRWSEISAQVLQPFQQYQVPLIQLRKETPKEAVCLVFRNVNTGGVSLDAFELLTASFAADDFGLRADWERHAAALAAHPVLREVEKTDFLQAITLLATRDRRLTALREGVSEDRAPGIGCKPSQILDLSVEAYRRWAEPVAAAFIAAARLLHGEFIFRARDLPYRTQIVPLAAALAALGPQAQEAWVRALLCRWFWCGVFGELYGGATETRFAQDLPDLLAWVAGGGEPRTVSDAYFAPARLLTLRTRNSAAYKGVAALLMRDGARDLLTGEALESQRCYEERVDVHHIFPKRWCEKNRVPADRMDSIINKTVISARTNRTIGGHAPSDYLAALQQRTRLDRPAFFALVASHAITPAHLEADDFEAFFQDRSAALLARIHRVMGGGFLLEPPASAPSPALAPTADEILAALQRKGGAAIAALGADAVYAAIQEAIQRAPTDSPVVAPTPTAASTPVLVPEAASAPAPVAVSAPVFAPAPVAVSAPAPVTPVIPAPTLPPEPEEEPTPHRASAAATQLVFVEDDGDF